MKNVVKKLLVAFMALFVAFTSTDLAYAATGTITVNTGKHDVTGVDFNVYQLFSATKSGDRIAYVMNADFVEFFEGKGHSDDETAQQYVTDNVATKAFQDELKTYITTKKTTPKATFKGQAGVKTYTTGALDYGYYAIIPSGDIYTPSFTTLGADNQNVYLKGKTPDVIKKVNDKDWDSAKIGETVHFKVESMVPNMTGYTEYHFKLTDIMSTGLTVTNETLNATVTIGGEKLTADKFTAAVEGQNITITIHNFISYAAKANEPIIFTYDAVLNEGALSTNPETNKANVHWGNDPANLNNGTPDIVKVVTHKLTIKKQNEEGMLLPDAIFKLYQGTTTDPQNLMSFVKLEGDGKYRVATATDLNTTNELTSKSGIIEIEGLKDGDYRLEEIKAPDGYNKLKNAVEIKIVASSSDEGATITVSGNDPTVVNYSGVLLPETGGMGTILFTVVGTIGIVAIAYSFIAGNKKKKAN